MNIKKINFLWPIITFFCIGVASLAYAKNENSTVNALTYEVIAERSHKTSLFTQGLLIKNNHFFESSGLYNKSILVTYPIAEPDNSWAKLSAPFTAKRALPDNYFAEGLALLHNKLYLLTWQEKTLFVYDATTLNFLTQLHYSGEGWGLTTDGTHLIRSDGSDQLFFHNPENFSHIKSISVKLNHKPVTQINELEFAEGFIWANIWHDNHIMKIDPKTGNVVGILDASDIVKSLHLNDSESVLNGIAYDSDKKVFWLTGKSWPKMFSIKIANQ